MALTEWPSKLEYLKSKVFGEAQDNIKSYKFNWYQYLKTFQLLINSL